MAISLPIDRHLGAISEALGKYQALVLVAPPGAGKTTRLPPALLSAPWLENRRIMVSQPRRVAARAAARRVCSETGLILGKEVGYAVRGETVSSAETRLLFCTEGVLAAMLQADPFLTGVGAVLLDEFHERSLTSDLNLALLKDILATARPDLRVVVCSATLDPKRAADYLRAEIFEVEGRVFPVEISYLARNPKERLADEVADGVRAVFAKRPEGRGDVLVFLPGAGEIRRAGEALEVWAKTKGIKLVTLHGDLPAAAQDEVLTPSPTPRIILATNVAETSLTIDGVSAVVDSGLVNLAEFDAELGMTRLSTVRAARANSNQRSGRAGRTGPGVALRLWTLHEETSRRDALEPEVLRADLSRAVLELAAWGCSDPSGFDWFERPPAEGLAAARELLIELGALTGEGHATPDGLAMLALPLEVRIARLFISARNRSLGRDAADLAAVMEERDLSLTGRAFGGASHASHPSDPLHRIDLLNRSRSLRFSRDGCRSEGIDAGAAGAADREAKRLVALLPKGANMEEGALEKELLKLIFDAYPDRAAKLDRESGRYVLASGRRAALGPGSVVAGEEFLVAVRLSAGKRGELSDSTILWGSALDPAWLYESGRVLKVSETFYDREREKVTGRELTRYGEIILKSAPVKPDPEEASRILLSEVVKDWKAALKPDEKCENLLARCRFLTATLGGERFRPLDDAVLFEVAEELSFGCTSLRELREADLFHALLRRLTPEERRLLEREAPDRVGVPSGREVTIDYTGEGGPAVTVKLQEVFGLTRSPLLAEGRVPLCFTLVGPSGRPLAVTADLASFWKNAYPMVLKEMRGRYPKHYWPENPLDATPVFRTVKKRM